MGKKDRTRAQVRESLRAQKREAVRPQVVAWTAVIGLDLDALSPAHVVNPRLPPVRDSIVVTHVRGEMVTFDCGHTGHAEFYHDAYGETVILKQGRHDRCGVCSAEELKQISARCALCEHIILPGGGVALYAFEEKVFPSEKVRSWFQFVEHDATHKSVIGCMRGDCCPSGGFYAGTWTEDGFRHAFPNRVSMAATAMTTGKIVVANIG